MKPKNINIKSITQTENARLRVEDSNLHELMDSIKRYGLLQPIAVRKVNGNYDLVFGNRRFQAFNKLGYGEIPAFVLDNKTDTDMLVLNLVENLQRESVSMIEQARIIGDLEQMGLNEKEISVRLSIPLNRVRIMKNSYKIPKQYKHKVVTFAAGRQSKDGKIPATVAVKISSLRKEFGLSPVEIDSLYKASLAGELSTDKLRFATLFLKQGKTVSQALKLIKNVKIVDTKFPLLKSELDAAQKRFKKPASQVIRGILTGDYVFRFSRI